MAPNLVVVVIVAARVAHVPKPFEKYAATFESHVLLFVGVVDSYSRSDGVRAARSGKNNRWGCNSNNGRSSSNNKSNNRNYSSNKKRAATSTTATKATAKALAKRLKDS